MIEGTPTGVPFLCAYSFVLFEITLGTKDIYIIASQFSNYSALRAGLRPVALCTGLRA